jgi:hypothetical protein
LKELLSIQKILQQINSFDGGAKSPIRKTEKMKKSWRVAATVASETKRRSNLRCSEEEAWLDSNYECTSFGEISVVYPQKKIQIRL